MPEWQKKREQWFQRKVQGILNVLNADGGTDAIEAWGILFRVMMRVNERVMERKAEEFLKQQKLRAEE